jgi:chemotaxis protein CheD
MPVTTNILQSDAARVEMGEIKVATKLTDRLVAHGLGACVGLCLYDPNSHVIGLAHVVLPSYQPSPPSRNKKEFPGKFAQNAVPALIEEMCRAGAERSNLVAALAGGSHIFSGFGNSASAMVKLEFGERTVQAINEALGAESIPLLAQDTGGNHGRTLSIRSSDGCVFVQPIGGDEWQLACLGKTASEALSAESSN